MQNLDMYSNNKVSYDYNTRDVREFMFPYTHTHNKTFSQKKAHRILTIISALIILSFTAGLVVGIKFAGGQDKAIIDPQTKLALNTAIQKAKTLVEPQQKLEFPKTEYPYVIKIGNTYNKSEATTLANLLSKAGQRVIIAKNNQHYTVYAGPFTSLDEAKKSLKIIMAQSNNANLSNAFILKR